MFRYESKDIDGVPSLANITSRLQEYEPFEREKIMRDWLKAHANRTPAVEPGPAVEPAVEPEPYVPIDVAVPTDYPYVPIDVEVPTDYSYAPVGVEVPTDYSSINGSNTPDTALGLGSLASNIAPAQQQTLINQLLQQGIDPRSVFTQGVLAPSGNVFERPYAQQGIGSLNRLL